MGPRVVAPQPDWGVHITGFITVCEAFLGMEPHVDLFQWIFSGRALSEGKPPRIAPVGGICPIEEVKAIGPLPHVLPL